MTKEKKGINISTKYILKYLGKDKINRLLYFVDEVKKRECYSFTNIEEVKSYLGQLVENFVYSLTEKELSSLRYYTGYNFRNINNTLRRNWNYEENGLLTKEKIKEYEILCNEISKIIEKFPSLEIDLKTYRGVNIRAFKDYGINDISELDFLQGNYIYEPGFTSTSLFRNNSFFIKEPEWGGECDIEIEYYIAKECQDGALLLNNEISYATSQTEYVINSGSLSLITEVNIDHENKKAKLKAVLIPKSLWATYDITKKDNNVIKM